MKKILLILAFWLVLLYPLNSFAENDESQFINERIENEAYLKIDGNLFIDVYGEKSFFKETEYTIYPESTHLYAIGAEWEMEWIEFDQSAYLRGIETLDLTISDLKNNQFELTDRKEMIQFFSVQDEGLSSDIEKISKAEILFDNEYRPNEVSYFDKGGKVSYSYTIDYLSKFSYYSSYYVRKSLKPVYYIYYTASHLFETQNFMEGFLFSIIMLLSVVLFVWAINRCLSGIWRLFTKRDRNKREKIITIVSSFIVVYGILAISMYGFLGLYLLVFVTSIHWFFGRVKKMFFLLISVLAISSCSTKRIVEINDFKEKIYAGMTPSQVESKMGKPEKISNDNDEVIRQREEDSESSIDIWTEKNYDYFDLFFGEKEEYFFEKMDQEVGWSYYEYECERGAVKKVEKFRIYFVDNEVVWMSFP
ncbi:hypothetical protein I6N96_13680 [Enterococcus sp. BWM-S5]|uniref:DUF2812 domain-containing protein n=1 Tax=Enterococcus larvae TaxID=2794352 RepID=A0ABS4CLG9_9ENTE|nr:hypothetical protein [Enterococcus larvae]MBP1047329.1 hypothetical protein [Enterococcus larvae]